MKEAASVDLGRAVSVVVVDLAAASAANGRRRKDFILSDVIWLMGACVCEGISLVKVPVRC